MRRSLLPHYPILPLLSLLLVCCSCLISGCRQSKPDDSSVASVASAPIENETEWADSIIHSMSVEERIGQLFMPAVYSRLEPSDLEQLRFYADSCHVGGLLLLQGSAEEASAVGQEMNRISAVAPWIAIDAEWGLGMRIKDAPAFPRNGSMNPRTDTGILYDYGEELARECRVLGINMVMGPVADIADKESFIGSRSFGSDPQRVADLATAYASGLESGGVVSVAKHFPGHGRGKADSHLETPVIDISKDSLEATDLYPFRRYADAGLSAIMAGHIVVTALDSTGLPATVSKSMLSDLLREDIGFEGLIITDALNMGGVSGYKAADAIAAGADIVVAPAHTLEEIREVARRVKNGILPLSVINDRCRRILLYKYRRRVDGPLKRKQITGNSERLRKILNFGTDSLITRLAR